MSACGLWALSGQPALHRIVQAALRGFFQDVYDRVAVRLSASLRTALDALLVAGPEATPSLVEWPRSQGGDEGRGVR
jgi:hypothetical protein